MIWIVCKVLWVFFMQPFVIGICWVDGYWMAASSTIWKSIVDQNNGICFVITSQRSRDPYP